MRFAAIADVHGNCAALEAVLADIAKLGVTDIVNLGDHVSGPLEARRTADLLMERNIPSIQGDQDRRLLALRQVRSEKLKRWDYHQLDQPHFDWLASLPPTMTYREDVFLCHGSPRADDAYWLDRVTGDGNVEAASLAEIESQAAGIAASLILCAHTHIPRVVRLRDGRMAVNPGSVGLPGYESSVPIAHVVQTGIPDACYALIERGVLGWSVTLRYVPYDRTAMVEMALRGGLPAWANALATGWVTRED